MFSISRRSVITAFATALLVNALSALSAGAQVSASFDYVGQSACHDHDGVSAGSGGYTRVKLSGGVPVVLRRDSLDRLTAWIVSLSGSYAALRNYGEAVVNNPREMLNTSFNVSTVQPLHGRWGMVASVGVGIFAPPDHIRLSSILFNGGALFGYKFPGGLTLGFGGGLTNSYGIPMVLPMLYINWERRGKYNLRVNMTTGLDVSAWTRLSEHWRLEATLLKMEGMSAVVPSDGEQKIYSMSMLRSSLQGVWRPLPRCSVYAGVGVLWSRTTCLTERRLKEFFKIYNHHGKYRFDPAPLVTIGVKYGI